MKTLPKNVYIFTHGNKYVESMKAVHYALEMMKKYDPVNVERIADIILKNSTSLYSRHQTLYCILKDMEMGCDFSDCQHIEDIMTKSFLWNTQACLKIVKY